MPERFNPADAKALSTMLLTCRIVNLQPFPLRVSIPLWCDCDNFINLVTLICYVFQSHCGAIATA
ncbi:MAG: hypothetical protein RMK89_13870 [Armatimonadota bacterium]|nr:hypothetical protein [Armatimonadota bacterium]MDW8144533.1 hypothetical protein [Armatimonadota bacterium]